MSWFWCRICFAMRWISRPLGSTLAQNSLSHVLLCKPDDPLCMLLCSVVCIPGSFTGIAAHFLLLEAAPDFETPTLLLHSLVDLHVPPPGLPLQLMVLRVTTNLLSSTIKSALEVVPDLLRWLRSWVYYLPTRTLLLELGLKLCSTGWVSKFPSPESWSKLSRDSRHSSNLEDTDKEAVLC